MNMENLTVREIAQAVHGRLLCGRSGDGYFLYQHRQQRYSGKYLIYTPIIGERVDAHQFIGQVLKKVRLLYLHPMEKSLMK